MCSSLSERIVIIGAGGHGKVVADIASKLNYKNIVFLDDNATESCLGFPIVGKLASAQTLNDGNTKFVIAVGNNDARKNIANSNELPWITLVHPSAELGMNVSLGEGTVVMAKAVINPSATVGKHCIINTAAVIEHDNELSDFVHVSPKAALGGTVKVGECTHIGIGATVKNNIKICESTVIGAAAAVVKNIENAGTYVGVPAHVIK